VSLRTRSAVYVPTFVRNVVMSVKNMMHPTAKSVPKLVTAALKNVPQWPAKLQTSRGKRSGST
jgi:hypothetical protein